jgi:hypothetical protein
MPHDTSTYAREGFRFYCVETPSVFLEYELPEDEAHATRRERQKYQELVDLADLHRTVVTHASYRRG